MHSGDAAESLAVGRCPYTGDRGTGTISAAQLAEAVDEGTPRSYVKGLCLGDQPARMCREPSVLFSFKQSLEPSVQQPRGIARGVDADSIKKEFQNSGAGGVRQVRQVHPFQLPGPEARTGPLTPAGGVEHSPEGVLRRAIATH